MSGLKISPNLIDLYSSLHFVKLLVYVILILRMYLTQILQNTSTFTMSSIKPHLIEKYFFIDYFI